MVRTSDLVSTGCEFDSPPYMQAGKPSRYVAIHLNQLSLLFLGSREIEYAYWPVRLGSRLDVLTCVGWKVTL